jgi:hypothetical protein
MVSLLLRASPPVRFIEYAMGMPAEWTDTAPSGGIGETRNQDRHLTNGGGVVTDQVSRLSITEVEGDRTFLGVEPTNPDLVGANTNHQDMGNLILLPSLIRASHKVSFHTSGNKSSRRKGVALGKYALAV